MLCGALCASSRGSGAVTPDLQKAIRASTFEVVLKKPEHDPLTYEKPLPLELLPYIERTDAYQSIGTAFALGHNTYITAKHVITVGIDSQFGAPALRASDGKVYSIDRILKFSAHEDFVVFSIKDDPAPAGFSTSTSPRIDDPVMAVGNALGEGIVIRDGLFTSETPEAQDGRWKWVRFSAAASPGNSGGPLLDGDGRVIGIVIGKSPNENLNYALPIGQVLGDQTGKARFDERIVTSLPFLQGSDTYVLKGEFSLPLPWAEFSKAYQDLSARALDAARAKFLQSRADSLFPNGAGTEALLFDIDANGALPWLVVQQPDDSWEPLKPEYATTNLPTDGSVKVGGVLGMQFLRLVRPNLATDEAFYHDSKSFMDLALKGLNIRRDVGTDQVRVTSLGSAVAESEYTDRYGRRWQVRTWALPYLDAYLVGFMLPAPDGYSAVFQMAPSTLLREVQRRMMITAEQIEVSYRGSAGQWRAFLSRRALLPTALDDVHLSGQPTWILRGKRFTMAVPPRIFEVNDNSLLALSMAYMRDGDHVVWDVAEVWWYRDDREQVGLALARRPKPPGTATLELRNRYSDMYERHGLFDGELSREGADTYLVSTILDVPGRTAGTVSADLVYQLSLLLDGARAKQDLENLRESMVSMVQVHEHGVGVDVAASRPAANATLASSAQIDQFLESVTHWAHETLYPYEKDIRGRIITDDLRDYVTVPQTSSGPGEAENGGAAVVPSSAVREAADRAAAITHYWTVALAVVRNRDMWKPFLEKNHLTPDTPHKHEVVAAEAALLAALSQPPGEEWVQRATALAKAYAKERETTYNAKLDSDTIIFHPRQSKCPVTAARTSGRAEPAIGEIKSSLEEFYPRELRKYQVEGAVVLALKIDADGCATATGIAGSSGSELMDAAAMSWAETAQFLPAERNGSPVDSSFRMRVVFKISN
jgi:TonB family protein